MMLGAYTGMMMNFIGCIRNSIFSRLVKKTKGHYLHRYASALFFCFLFLLRGQALKVC